MPQVNIFKWRPGSGWIVLSGGGDPASGDVQAIEAASLTRTLSQGPIAYLWAAESQNAPPHALEYARGQLEYTLAMQAEDGEFYNFVTDAEGTINERGNTSFKSLGWWAMRGLWSLGEGVRVFDTLDPDYANTLADAYLRTEAAIAATMTNYGEYNQVHGFRVPAWIPSSEPSVAGVGLLGLAGLRALLHEGRVREHSNPSPAIGPRRRPPPPGRWTAAVLRCALPRWRPAGPGPGRARRAASCALRRRCRPGSDGRRSRFP